MLTIYDVMPKEFVDALNDPLVTDIAIRDNGHGYITRLGQHVDIGHMYEKVPLMLCLAASGAEPETVINDEQPSLECRLPGGQRLVGKRPEVGGRWTVTIRDPMGRRLSWSDLIGFGTLSEAEAELIEAHIVAGDSGIVAGGMGSGKTTLLNTMLGSTSLSNKVTVKLEAVEEILGPPICTTYLIGPHCSMENAREKALRESAKVFIVGEARGGTEMKEVMTTMGTGHQSFTTLHADCISDVPFRIENMIRQTKDTRTQEQMHEDIVKNIDFCIYMQEREGGKRVVADIASFEMRNRVAIRRELDSSIIKTRS